MRILMAHNYYQQPGGEDRVFAAESALLEARGHTVVRLTRHNDDVRGMSPAAVARAAVWNSDTYDTVRRIALDERIEVAHFHNTFPLISPAAYYAARGCNIPVVQTLHNYRLLCPGSLLFREGRVCEDCLNRAVPWPAVAHGCYRGSTAQSAAVAGMLTVHRALGTWSSAVDRYIALTGFARDKFIEGGLPARKIGIKPNLLASDPGPGSGSGDFALFVGRITEDKGVNVLLSAWRELPEIPLKIAGSGPLFEEAARRARELANVEMLGACSGEVVANLMKAARVLVVPSLWYEGLPMTVVEAYASGLPVIASDRGGLSSLIEDGKTGAHFPAGDVAGLAAAVRELLSNGGKLAEMRAQARAAYEQCFAPEANYRALLREYDAAARHD